MRRKPRALLLVPNATRSATLALSLQAGLMRVLRWHLPVLFSLVVVLLAPVAGLAAAGPISLNGDWHFLADPAGALKVVDLAAADNVRPTRIPSSWQSQFADLRDYAGVAWYWRSVHVDALPPGQVALLRFAAVDYRAEVYVNGQEVGSHEGGYLPFEFDVTAQLRAGENQVAVRVTDPGARPSEVEGIKYAEIPHGKQSWYVQTSGLWQDVELEIRPCLRLETLHIRASAEGEFSIQVGVVNPAVAAAEKSLVRLGLELLDPGGKVVWEEARDLDPGDTSSELSGRLANPWLWSLDNPALYTLRVNLASGDTQSTRFGFRTFEAREGKFYLNGRVIYLRGALDQDFYPQTVYTPPSLDYLREEMRQARVLGLNLLRCHIKVPDPRYLEAADETGLLVWYEIPNWDKLTEDSKRRALTTLRGMVERDWNHPCIVMVSILNESWGANLREAADRAWLKATYTQAKAMVPGWLVVDNSACCRNFHVATDLADFHQYNAIPDHASDFDRFVGDMAQRPGWLFSPYGDALPRGDEPLVLSEFGNWGLPLLPDPKPWWFGRTHGGNKITLPEGIEDRFAAYQYSTLFPNITDLLQAAQWHQFRSLKYEIESLRARPQIQGYVITEFTDLNWEANGLLDMWRRPKAYADELAKLQQDDLLIVRADNRNLAPGDKAEAGVYLSHYSSANLADAQVSWEVVGTPLKGSFSVSPVTAGTAAKVGRVEFTVPPTQGPEENVLAVRLSAGGKSVSESSLHLFFYPPKPPELPPPVSFHDPAGRLRRLVNEMRARGYLEPTGSEAFPVLVSSTFDEQVRKALQEGGRVILLASDAQTLAGDLKVERRAGSDLSGNWISDLLWVRKDEQPFRAIGFNTFPGFEAQAVVPATVVLGVPPEDFRDVLAGMFYGWIHSNVGALVQVRCGKGKLLICTFTLATTYGSDPYATYLLDALVRYAVSDFQPKLEIPLSAP
jgi:hypothetical protein